MFSPSWLAAASLERRLGDGNSGFQGCCSHCRTISRIPAETHCATLATNPRDVLDRAHLFESCPACWRCTAHGRPRRRLAIQSAFAAIFESRPMQTWMRSQPGPLSPTGPDCAKVYRSLSTNQSARFLVAAQSSPLSRIDFHRTPSGIEMNRVFVQHEGEISSRPCPH